MTNESYTKRDLNLPASEYARNRTAAERLGLDFSSWARMALRSATDYREGDGRRKRPRRVRQTRPVLEECTRVRLSLSADEYRYFRWLAARRRQTFSSWARAIWRERARGANESDDAGGAVG